MFGWWKKNGDGMPQPAGSSGRSAIVPRIKNPKFIAALRKMGLSDEQMPVIEPLAADLLVTYAFDLGASFRMASREALAGLGLQPTQLRELAVENLKRILPQIGYYRNGPLRRIATGENLEACTLLAGPFWDLIAAEHDGEIVATAPSRDVVLFCSSRAADGLAALREESAEILKVDRRHGISDRLLVWRHERWHEFSD